MSFIIVFVDDVMSYRNRFFNIKLFLHPWNLVDYYFMICSSVAFCVDLNFLDLEKLKL